MSKMDKNMTRLHLDEIRKLDSRTDWARVRTMNDAEITAAALSDPDALPLDDAFFAIARVSLQTASFAFWLRWTRFLLRLRMSIYASFVKNSSASPEKQNNRV